MKARRILSLDGGGIRGLVSSLWLQAAEDALARAGKPGLRNNFDLLAGTSSGALIVCGLAVGIAPDKIMELFREQRDRIFPGIAERLWSRAGRVFTQGPSAPRYSGKGLDEVLQEVFGKTTLGQLEDKVMVTSYDTISRTPIIFKSFDPRHKDLLIWEVCRATASAPTYFPAHGMVVDGQQRSLIDGGVVANNPTALAIAEALRQDSGVSQCSELLVLSVGSGARNRPISLKSAQEWGALEWAVPIIDVLFDGNSDSVDYIARQLVGDSYFRMQTALLAGLDDLDDTSASNLVALEKLAGDYLAREATHTLLGDMAKRT